MNRLHVGLVALVVACAPAAPTGADRSAASGEPVERSADGISVGRLPPTAVAREGDVTWASALSQTIWDARVHRSDGVGSFYVAAGHETDRTADVLVTGGRLQRDVFLGGERVPFDAAPRSATDAEAKELEASAAAMLGPCKIKSGPVRARWGPWLARACGLTIVRAHVGTKAQAT